MIKVKILFFASIRERTGIKEIEMELPDEVHVGALKKILAERYPEIAPALGSVIISINREFAFDRDRIPADAEIAVFPPVSGGVSNEEYPTVFQVTDGAIDTDEIISNISLPTTGAVCIFSGMVRGITTRDVERETKYLEYESYQEMAESKMKQVVDEIRRQWPDIVGIALIQRIGRLYPGTPTVMIACTAAHRDTGIFEAARYGIDRLKEIVPVWKKDVCLGGDEWVEGEYFPKRGD